MNIGRTTNKGTIDGCAGDVIIPKTGEVRGR